MFFFFFSFIFIFSFFLFRAGSGSEGGNSRGLFESLLDPLADEFTYLVEAENIIASFPKLQSALQLTGVEDSMKYLENRKYDFCLILLFLFCFVLFCFVLFCFVLFCFILLCFALFCFVLYFPALN